MGVSLSTLKRAHMAYDGGGIKALKPKVDRRSQRENMTLTGKKVLVACFARTAGAAYVHYPTCPALLMRYCDVPVSHSHLIMALAGFLVSISTTITLQIP
jgi:hypothetical protein